MKIAQVAPLYEAVPPKLYGGTERIVAYLTDALIELGHDVTLFASAGATTRAHLVPCRHRPLWLDQGLTSDVAAHLTMLQAVRLCADEFDVIHFHLDLSHLPMFQDFAERTVTTVHNRLDVGDLRACYASFPEFGLVAISDHQRQLLPNANWAGMVHNGLPIDQYPLNLVPEGDYLAFLGRLSREKRPDRAIEIAKRAGMKLKIAAKIGVADREYVKQEVEPLLDDPLVEFVGEISDADKGAFLGHARALLFPIDWPEPFGLAMIEAMACGTPVIAYDNGAVSEVVDEGITGLIVDSIDAAVDAVDGVRALDRRQVRRTFERRFAASVMARNYLRTYDEVLPESALLVGSRPLPKLYSVQ